MRTAIGRQQAALTIVCLLGATQLLSAHALAQSTAEQDAQAQVDRGRKPLAAQPAAEQSAQALFDHGRKLMEAQQYAQACAKFAASHQLDPAVGTLLNLAYCWKQVGRSASAWTAYREAASLAYFRRQAEREAFARAEARELEARLARLEIRIAQPTDPELEVRRDGVVVPRDAWGIELPVDPGEHTIEAEAPGRDRFMTTVFVHPESKAMVVVPALRSTPADPYARLSAPAPLPALAETHARAAEPAPVAGGTADRDSLLPELAISVGAAGVVALGIAGFFALRTSALDAEARAICTDESAACSAGDVLRHGERLDEARESRTAAYVSASIGAACAVGALALLRAAQAASDPAAARAPRRRPLADGVALGVAPGEIAIIAHGRW
jgi:hypothetical protein